MDAPIYEIRPLLRKSGFLYSPAAAPKTGVVFSLGARAIDLAVPVDTRAEFDDEEKGVAIIRVVEQFRLRINDETAVVALGESGAAVRPVKVAKGAEGDQAAKS